MKEDCIIAENKKKKKMKRKDNRQHENQSDMNELEELSPTSSLLVPQDALSFLSDEQLSEECKTETETIKNKR